jgi:Uma2 family endonuclease
MATSPTRPRSTDPHPLTEADYPRPLTWADWQAMPEENQIVELWQGEIVMSPAANMRHSDIVAALIMALGDVVRKMPGARLNTAPTDVRLGETTVLQPDILVMTGKAGGRRTAQGIEGPPDLVVEVLSPSTRKRDLVRKAALYAEAGVPEYWIIDADAGRLLVQRLVDCVYERELIAADTVACEALGGAAVDIAWLREYRDDASGVREEPAEYDAGDVGEDA